MVDIKLKHYFLCLLMSMQALPALYAQSGPYSRLQFKADAKTMSTLALLGVDLEHLSFDGLYYTGEFSKEETALIKTQCPIVLVQIADLEKHFAESQSVGDIRRSGTEYPVPEGFILGSMGGYFTLSELDSHISVMEHKYPEIFKIRDTIGLSVQGRPIYALKVSDHVNTDEEEVEVLYTALHHAREPVSLSQLVYYLYYLLENYSLNAEVKALVDNSELYFIPVVNPDGYAYNQQTNPGGGGYWRKNRKKNPDGSYGVDLNRNYGYNWGLNDTGSSGTTVSPTYRGLQAFSEPETRTVRDFCLKRQFAAALNYHAFGDLLIYPWGPDPGPSTTPDQMLFVEMAEALTFSNRYRHGTSFETLRYSVNGDANDWMYGEQNLKNKIMSFVPEVGTGTDGFWPLKNRILPLCDANIRQNLNLVKLMLGHRVDAQTAIAHAERKPYPNPVSDRLYLPAHSDILHVELRDITGRLILIGLPDSQGVLDLSMVQAGVYTCEVYSAGSGKDVHRLIVSR